MPAPRKPKPTTVARERGEEGGREEEAKPGEDAALRGSRERLPPRDEARATRTNATRYVAAST